MRVVCGQSGELHFVQPKFGQPRRLLLRRGAPAVAQAEGDILRHRQVREQGVILKQQPGLALLRRQPQPLSSVAVACTANTHMPGLRAQ